MGMKWTKDQKKVISLRNRNILVSAAAGSGKTAVLVQRILGKVMDPKKPVDIDRLLIMTFTRAAAGEMRERISKALDDALYHNPDNEHLQRQTTLIHTAQITTIDGFCSYVIRNYFHLIGLDPGYRTGDEGELKLLREDVLKRLLEDYYAEHQQRYEHFVECYAPGKSDEGIRDLILRLYDVAMSNPYPEEWLDKCLDAYQTDDREELDNNKWMDLLWNGVLEEVTEAGSLAHKARNLCTEEGGPYLYEEALTSDILFIEEIIKRVSEKEYDKVAELFAHPSFARLSTKKPKEYVDDQMKEQVKSLREEEKDILKETGNRYFQSSEEELLESMKICREPLEVLVELTKEFIARFGEKKREKNLLDFTDMEHFALDILMTKDEDGWHRSQAAKELSQKYDEVLVDEYQDSNMVQEMITVCVSGWADNRKNIFMVGDVKQSIYGFRLARPELFMEKYKHYSLEDSTEQRIDLDKNFRSRPEVLESVNYIFGQIMGEDLGGITYDEAAALYPGAVFPEGADEDFVKTEILLVEKDGEELEEEQTGQDARELEALAIAHRIREIAGKECVVDKETGKYRPAEYGDMVILLRTASGWSETFGEVLSSQGIPSYTISRTGYFSALEVVTVLNYLKICDNPLQDIPMAGVLRSPVVGCTTQELAILRSEYPEGKLYESICACIEEGQLCLFQNQEKEQLKEKLRRFVEQLTEFRSMAVYTPVHQMILQILEKTGYGNYARALPDGAQRSANLTMLVEKARDYEKTSYRGLFNFVRYIEHLQKYEVDYGEVNLAGDGRSAVQIMTIHKSKGLEFPIVFVAGMGKQFNFQDLNARLLIHPELGVGADAILPEKRVIAPTLNKQLIRRELLKESLGEELRVLYVAMTRAKEKLILSGTIGKLEEKIVKLSRFQDNNVRLLPIGTRLKGKKYWDYILPALSRHRCMDELYQEYGIAPERKNLLYDDMAEFLVRKVTAAELAKEEVLYQAGEQIQEEVLKNWDCDRVFNETIRKELEERFGFSYPYEYLREIPVKVSVSELKKRSYHDDYDKEENLLFEPDIIPLIPAFMAEKEEEYTGAARGTAYHRVMECLDYEKTDTDEQLQEQLEKLLEQKKLMEAEEQCIRIPDVRAFLESSIGMRMKKAALAHKLYREQPFVISRKASEIDERWPGEETVLVQGIIDAFFYEENELVLVDYKTDAVRKGEEMRLVELYHTQLEDYAQALERMTGKRVKEKYIYSFTLNKAILL